MAQVGQGGHGAKGNTVKINIYGLGYVGSVSAACLAADGHEVLGIDIDKTKVETINRGESPVVESGLSELIHRGVASNKLRATTETAEDGDVSIVCVGTPSNDNGSLCLSHISRATEQIGDFIRTRASYHLVCIRSTVLPGTVETHIIPILEHHSTKKAGRDFGICMNPEFLREGSSIRDYYSPPFTIIGQLDARSGDVIAELYSSLSAPVIRTKLAVAEMVKYAGNAFHALKITFANEIGTLCKQLGVDGTEVMELFCRDPKLNISSAYLQPGFAFGGSCLPKDLRALLYKAKELDLEPPVLRSILISNASHVEEAYRLVRKTGKKKVAVLGLSFKPGTDDLRESPIVALIEILIGKGHEVAIYDQDVALPRLHGSNRFYIDQAIPHMSRLLKASIDEAIGASEVVVVAKRSSECEESLKRLANGKPVVDLVRALTRSSDPKGTYEGICW
jgi:GDP-mannose 6-dehydrogenase